MKFTTSVSAITLLAGSALASPFRAASPLLNVRDDVQTAHLTFQAGPVNYTMAVPANGQVYETNSDLSVNLIDAPDYDAISQCKFVTDSEVTLVNNIDTATGNQQIAVGPPQPIRSVSCSGMCVPTYGDCYNSQGQFVGPCCNGFCAADKCRPWNINTN